MNNNNNLNFNTPTVYASCIKPLCTKSKDSQGNELISCIGNPIDISLLAPYWLFFEILQKVPYKSEYNILLDYEAIEIFNFLKIVNNLTNPALNNELKKLNNNNGGKTYKFLHLFNNHCNVNYEEIKNIIDFFMPTSDESWIFQVKFNNKHEYLRSRLDKLLLNIEEEYNESFTKHPYYWQNIAKKIYNMTHVKISILENNISMKKIYTQYII